MTEVEALAAMKRQCKILSKVMSDEELIGFLNDFKQDGSYDIRRSIYHALGSAITVVDQSFSRGGVSATKVDLIALRREFRPLVVSGIVRD